MPWLRWYRKRQKPKKDRLELKNERKTPVTRQSKMSQRLLGQETLTGLAGKRFCQFVLFSDFCVFFLEDHLLLSVFEHRLALSSRYPVFLFHLLTEPCPACLDRACYIGFSANQKSLNLFLRDTFSGCLGFACSVIHRSTNKINNRCNQSNRTHIYDLSTAP